jgi:hypothetical protein
MQFDDCREDDILNCLYWFDWDTNVDEEDLDGQTFEEFYELSSFTVIPPKRRILENKSKAEICIAFLKTMSPCCKHNLEATLELEKIILTRGEN